jgi:hypothetical protein
MRYTIKTPLLISDWQLLRKSIFGDVEPVFEQFGGSSDYIVQFDAPQTPADLGPLVKVEVIPNL